MSDGYVEQDEELQLAVPAPDSSTQLQPQSPEVSSHPCVAHQELGFGFNTMLAFARRSSSFFQTLQTIAFYLPKDGPAAREGMGLVTNQRRWMYDVGCAVGAVVGTVYQLETNTLNELEQMWNQGQAPSTIKQLKKNFSATLENLKKLEPDRQLALAKIEECEKHANQMVLWQGEEMKIQHAAMELVARFGGSAQCEAYLKDLQSQQEALTRARDAERKAAEKLAGISGQREELQCQKVVYESIAANESGNLQKLQSRAKELDDAASAKAKEAANTFNIEYKIRSGFFFPSWVTDWVDNQGDVARWRAERFKETAKKAKEAEGDQALRAKNASAEAASIQGKLTTAAKEEESALKNLAVAARATAAAEAELLQTKSKVQALRSEHGDLDLYQIAALRDHMQKFPELLGATGMSNESMFTTMKGEIRAHERLCNRLAKFLNEDDDNECKMLMQQLKPVIAGAIENSKFFGAKLEPLKNQLAKQTDRMAAIEHANIPTPSRASATSSPTSHQPWELVSLADEEEEDLF
eukprot:Skav223459  [mRNA]  locus=scaffold184:277609:279186:+ [translate_table: standard]